MKFLCAAAAVVTLTMWHVGGARAQSPSAEAEQLFRDGKQLMKAGKYGEACAAFDASQKLDPSVVTLLNYADCQEKDHKIATAWGAFLDAERITRNDKAQAALNKTARERAKKLEPRLSFLVVSVPDEARVDGLELTRNAEKMEPGQWNRAIPVDGGDYTITGRAPGHEQWSTTVHVESENGRTSVDVPRFKVVQELMDPPPDDPAGGVDPDVATKPSGMLTGRRKVALGVAGVGLLGAAAGLFFALQVRGFEDDALALCPDNPCGANAAAGNAAREKAVSRARLANVSYGVAGVAVIAAAVLWLTGAPESRTVAPAVSDDSAGITIVGRF